MTYYFYDLETSGRDPINQRIMQFAGQRTDEELNLLGDPLVLYVKLTDEVLPEPEAIMLTGITPQKTISDGVSEAEFIGLFDEEVVSNTCFVGFNNIRFDDEFMRFTMWRNFYDPYQWQWKNDCYRWDLIDVARMTRALRPEGIEWPFTQDGKESNRLEELTEVNQLEHGNAHDALSDVMATIELAKLIKQKQPKIFDFLQKMSKKDSVIKFIEENPLFVHTSGRISGDFSKTSIFTKIAINPDRKGEYLLYDLRFNPEEFLDLSEDQLRDRWYVSNADLGKKTRLPVKGLKANKCPAIAPLGVLDELARERIRLNPKTATSNLKILAKNKDLVKKITKIWLSRESFSEKDQTNDVDGSLYNGFLSNKDALVISSVRKQTKKTIRDFRPKFNDNRLDELFFRYKARNFSSSLTSMEREKWNQFRRERLFSGDVLSQYGRKIQEITNNMKDKSSEYLLEELRLYVESILPED